MSSNTVLITYLGNKGKQQNVLRFKKHCRHHSNAIIFTRMSLRKEWLLNVYVCLCE